MTDLEVSAKYIPKFDGKLFSLFKMQITAYLATQNLLSVVENPVKGIPQNGIKFSGNGNGVVSSSSNIEEDNEAKTPADKQEVRKSMSAYNILLLSLGNEQLQMVVGIPRGNAYGVWSTLLARYERKTVASKMKLRNELHNITMNHGENIDMYISRIKQLMLSLSDMGSTLSTDEATYVLFKGLPEAYSATIDTLSLNDKLDFETACTHIRDRYERIKIHEENNDIINKNNSLLFVKDKTQHNHKQIQKICNTCGKHGHIPFHCHDNKDKLKCNYCKKVGHEQKNCWFLKKDNNKTDSEENALSLVENDEEYVF